MKFIQNSPYFWKYETTASYIFLMLQYFYILVFGRDINPDIAKEYVHLWYYDFLLFFPIIFLVFFPHKVRVILMTGLFVFGIFYFYTGLGFNTIFFNTFISIFLANRFLLFDICPTQKDTILRFRFLKILIIVPAIIITFFGEFILEYFGVIHPEVRGDGTVLTNFGRFLFFGCYYGGLAYFAFRQDRKYAAVETLK